MADLTKFLVLNTPLEICDAPGTTLYKTERYEKAGEYLRKAYAILSEKLGVDHPQTKNCKSWLEDLPKG